MVIKLLKLTLLFQIPCEDQCLDSFWPPEPLCLLGPDPTPHKVLGEFWKTRVMHNFGPTLSLSSKVPVWRKLMPVTILPVPWPICCCCCCCCCWESPRMKKHEVLVRTVFFLRMLQGGLRWMSPNWFFLKQHHPRDWTWWKFTLFGCVIRGYIVIYRYLFTYSKASTMPNRQLLLKTSLPDVWKQRKCRGVSRLSYGTLWRCHMPGYTETAVCYTDPQRNAVFNGLIFCRCWMMFGVPIQPYLLPPINQGDRIETWPKKACNKQKTVQRLRSWWLGGRLGQGAALSVVNTDNHILDLPPQPRIPVANEGLVVAKWFLEFFVPVWKMRWWRAVISSEKIKGKDSNFFTDNSRLRYDEHADDAKDNSSHNHDIHGTGVFPYIYHKISLSWRKIYHISWHGSWASKSRCAGALLLELWKTPWPQSPSLKGNTRYSSLKLSNMLHVCNISLHVA